eukprot:PhF_6_TR4811/c0_g1_i1/m.6627/K15789/TDH; threonine 3-dehydrogenase
MKSTTTRPARFLVTGALSQTASHFIKELRDRVGPSNVIATDVRMQREGARESLHSVRSSLLAEGPYLYVDVEDLQTLMSTIVNNHVQWVIHFASVKTGKAEQNHKLALMTNLNGFRNVMDVGRKLNVKVFTPSSVDVFGGMLLSRKDSDGPVPDDVALQPTTVYGISQHFVEQLGLYYFKKFDVDFRCLRYPGIVSMNTSGSNPSDYAAGMLRHASQLSSTTPFHCPVPRDFRMPLLYLPDVVAVTLKLCSVPESQLTRRVYNVQGMSISPGELEAAIRKRVPTFPDVIYGAGGKKEPNNNLVWPHSIDDTNLRRDVQWAPSYDIDRMVEHAMDQLKTL